ncbi:MAG: DUF6814 family protein, partial [Bacteroidota bacterium]
MNQLKSILGILWLLLGPALFIVLITSAIHNINANGKGDINKPLPWIIIIGIFTPVIIGLMIFGWYAFKGEYDKLPDESSNIVID